MKHNFKLKERLGALLLAMLFVLQAILGLVPVCITQAAPLTVETWDSDKVVDYGYRFNMKFQPGITTYESLGVIIWTGKLFQTMEKANVTQSAFV